MQWSPILHAWSHDNRLLFCGDLPAPSRGIHSLGVVERGYRHEEDMTPEERIVTLGVELPQALPPRGNYIACRQVGDLLYLAGHGPRLQDNTYRLGKIESQEQIPGAYADAQLTALNMLATIKAAVGELSRVVAVVKVLGLVNAAPTFTAHPRVIDGFSDLLVSVLGEAGRHPRSAFGVSSLPNGMTVEVEAVVQVST
jgi:enamine deaminase RidA (YjgF/YER057c/UK114 family)